MVGKMEPEREKSATSSVKISLRVSKGEEDEEDTSATRFGKMSLVMKIGAKHERGEGDKRRTSSW